MRCCLLIVLAAFMATPKATAMPSWLARIMDARGQSLCSGSLISANQVLTAGHCLAAKDASKVTIAFTNGQRRQVKAFVPYLEDGLAFPSFDLGIATLAEPVLDISPAKLGRRRGLVLQAAGFGLDPSKPRTTASGAPTMSQLQWQRRLHGFRLKNLWEVQVNSGKRLCRGDSGGPIYQEQDGVLILVGMVAGRAQGVGDFSPRCQEGNDLITELWPYREWLAAPQTKSRSNITSAPASLAEACRSIPLDSSAAPVIDELIGKYIELQSQVRGQDAAAIYLHCQDMDKLANAVTSGLLPLTLRQGVPIDKLNFLATTRSITLIDADATSLAALSRFVELRELKVFGVAWGTSLRSLAQLNLESLQIKHAPLVHDHEVLSKMQRGGTKVETHDLRPAESLLRLPEEK